MPGLPVGATEVERAWPAAVAGRVHEAAAVVVDACPGVGRSEGGWRRDGGRWRGGSGWGGSGGVGIAAHSAGVVAGVTGKKEHLGYFDKKTQWKMEEVEVKA